jgi:hypothetical protein
MKERYRRKTYHVKQIKLARRGHACILPITKPETPMQLHPTPIAATAIIAQIDSNADTGGDHFYADVNGREWEFTANEWFSDHPGDPGYWPATCKLIGCWSFDPDTDEVRFAGNRREAVAMIGEANVAAWERAQEE